MKKNEVKKIEVTDLENVSGGHIFDVIATVADFVSHPTLRVAQWWGENELSKMDIEEPADYTERVTF